MRWIGSESRSAAIVGSAVAMTVESMFSMNSADAMISAVTCGRVMRGDPWGGLR